MTGELGIPGLSSAKAIGRGGSGVVYRCRHDASGRQVAVKVLDQIVLDDEQASAFRADFGALAEATDDPILVTILAHGITASGNPYLVVDYIDGGSVGTIASTGTLDPDVAAAVLAEVCAAVDRLHQRGLVHGDIASSSVLLTSQAEPRLSGFGIAQYFAVGPHSAALGVSPAHSAPEVLGGHARSAQSDVWSLASVLMDTVCRATPFGPAGAPGADLVSAALGAQEPDVSQAPIGLHSILGAGLVRDPSLRCSAAQMAASLRQIAGPRLGTTAALVEPNIAISTTPSGLARPIPKNSGIFAKSAPPPGRRKVLGVVSALVIVFGLFVAAVATRPPDQPDNVTTSPGSSTPSPSASSSTSPPVVTVPATAPNTTAAGFDKVSVQATTTTDQRQATTTAAATTTTADVEATGDTSTTSTTDPDAATTTIDPNATTTTVDPAVSTTALDPDATTTTAATSTTTVATTTTSSEATTTTVADTTTTVATTTTAAATTTTAAATTTVATTTTVVTATTAAG